MSEKRIKHLLHNMQCENDYYNDAVEELTLNDQFCQKRFLSLVPWSQMVSYLGMIVLYLTIIHIITETRMMKTRSSDSHFRLLLLQELALLSSLQLKSDLRLWELLSHQKTSHHVKSIRLMVGANLVTRAKTPMIQNFVGNIIFNFLRK